MSNEWKRYLIMNTTTATSTAFGKVEKIVSRPTPIDLNEILKEEPKELNFADYIKEAQANE